MNSAYVGEFLGTAVLLLLGNGVVANVLLPRAKGANAGWIVITAGWAFAVMSGAFVAIASGSRDAHLNPAVTLGAAVTSGQWDKVIPYAVAQMLGAMLGQFLVWLHYQPLWRSQPDPGAVLACFSTGPAERAPLANFLSEAIGTAVLVLVAGSIFSRNIAIGGPAPGVGPLLVGLLVWGIGLSLGGPTGYAINPARDLGPRLVHAIVPLPHKGSSDWSYAWVPIAGPLFGAAIAGALVATLGL